MSVNRVVIKDLLGRDAVAAGTAAGRRLLCRLIERLAEAEPGPVFLDFVSVKTATASFLREAVLAFRAYVLDFAPGHFPVVANAEETVTNELEALLEHRKDTLLTCRLTERKATAPRVLGPLDPGLARALAAVRDRPGVTAGDLEKASPEKVTPAAWHNRLAMLSRRGLVVDDGGKPARYRFVLETV